MTRLRRRPFIHTATPVVVDRVREVQAPGQNRPVATEVDRAAVGEEEEEGEEVVAVMCSSLIQIRIQIQIHSTLKQCFWV